MHTNPYRKHRTILRLPIACQADTYPNVIIYAVLFLPVPAPADMNNIMNHATVVYSGTSPLRPSLMLEYLGLRANR
jgi:hypothetical protein